MPTPTPTQRNVEDAACPFCGQMVLGEEAARYAEQSMAILEEKLTAARELVAELEAAHRKGWARVEGSPEADQKEIASEKAHFAEDTDKLRQGVRQF